MRSIALAVVVAVGIALPVTAQDAAAERGRVWIDGSEIKVSRPIDQLVAHDFLQQLEGSADLTSVSLNSPGGYVVPALQKARAVNARGLKTSVLAEGQCHSSCSLVFLAGGVRVALGLLGVHQLSGIDDPSLTQTMISQIYEELVRFNTPSYLVSRMLRTPPDDIYVFSPEELERNAINVRAADSADLPQLQPIENWTRKD